MNNKTAALIAACTAWMLVSSIFVMLIKSKVSEKADPELSITQLKIKVIDRGYSLYEVVAIYGDARDVEVVDRSGQNPNEAFANARARIEARFREWKLRRELQARPELPASNQQPAPIN